MKTKLKRVKLAKEPVLGAGLKTTWFACGIGADGTEFETRYPKTRRELPQAARSLLNDGCVRVELFKATYNFVEAFEAK